MADKIHWGIIGTGNIARKFATGLAALPDAELVAVGSRSQKTADTFAREFNVPRRHASYDSLVDDNQVDAIYVSTPHTFHCENTLLALKAGKPVLCEKPFAINAREAKRMIAKARSKKLLLMEAMWMRCMPHIVRLRELLAEGVIGDVQMLTADFGFRADKRKGRLYDPALGGGALLDIGIYPLSLASMIFGPPTQITGAAEIGPTGVDEQAVMTLTHKSGRLAALYTSLRANTANEATIFGTKGRIKIHTSWWKSAEMTLILDDGSEEFLEVPYTSNGYQFEAAEFMSCLREGKRESAVMPLAETLSIMRTLDKLRAQWKLKYPME